jgi:hypothetical protein
MVSLKRAVALAALALVAPASAQALPAAGIAGSSVVTFDTDAPGALTGSNPVTGLAMGDSPADVDVRPATGQLYLVATTVAGASIEASLYTLDPGTGAATPVGGGPFVADIPASTAGMGIDFDPAADELRVVTTGDRSMRVDPDSAAVTADPALARAAGPEDIASIAYDGGAALHGWDHLRTRLVRIEGSTVTDAGGPSGVASTSAAAGFDIAPGGGAFVSVSDSLYRADPATGALTAAGALPAGTADLALLQPAPFDLPNGSLAVAEDAGRIVVPVRRPAARATTTVRYATANGSATARDYTPASGTLTFPPGEKLRSFELLVTDDATGELPETVELRLSEPTGGGSLGATSAATVTIYDDDPAPPRADRSAPRLLLAPDLRRPHLRRLLRGVTGAWSCTEACKATFELKLRKTSTVLGNAGRSLARGGPGRFKLNVSSAGRDYLRKRLRRSRRVKLTLAVHAADAAGNSRTARTPLSVRR